MKVMLLFFEDGEEDIVLKVQNLIRSVTRIDYMKMPQFETQSTSSALEIRENQRRVFCYGQEILLTKTEYEILLYLYKNANHVLTHGQIYERVWREPNYGEARKLVSHHVQTIRRKLGWEKDNRHALRCVRNFGYALEISKNG